VTAIQTPLRSATCYSKIEGLPNMRPRRFAVIARQRVGAKLRPMTGARSNPEGTQTGSLRRFAARNEAAA
jgi:hypothetical protein